jgi:antitoxin MazE
MTTTLQSWGNSQGIRLPKPLLASLGLETGSQVRIDLTPKNDAILIRPAAKPKPKVRLEDLAAAMPRNYKSAEFDWKPAGREVW